MGIGSLENPYVENPFAGRIVNVHWRHRKPTPRSASATWNVDPLINTFIYPDLRLHDLLLLSYTGDPFVIITRGLDILISVPIGFFWSLELATQYIEGALHRPPPDGDLYINIIQIDSGGSIIDTPISQTWSGGGGGEQTQTVGGKAASNMVLAVSGFMGSDAFYDGLRAQVTLSISNF